MITSHNFYVVPPFEKGGQGGISQCRKLKSPSSPFFKGG